MGGFALFGVQDDFILVIFNHNNHKFGDLLINYLTSLGESLSLASLGSLGSGRHFLSLGSSKFQIKLEAAVVVFIFFLCEGGDAKYKTNNDLNKIVFVLLASLPRLIIMLDFLEKRTAAEGPRCTSDRGAPTAASCRAVTWSHPERQLLIRQHGSFSAN